MTLREVKHLPSLCVSAVGQGPVCEVCEEGEGEGLMLCDAQG